MSVVSIVFLSFGCIIGTTVLFLFIYWIDESDFSFTDLVDISEYKKENKELKKSIKLLTEFIKSQSQLFEFQRSRLNKINDNGIYEDATYKDIEKALERTRK